MPRVGVSGSICGYLVRAENIEQVLRKMIENATSGKIDFIITKSLSRLPITLSIPLPLSEASRAET